MQKLPPIAVSLRQTFSFYVKHAKDLLVLSFAPAVAIVALSFVAPHLENLGETGSLIASVICWILIVFLSLWAGVSLLTLVIGRDSQAFTLRASLERGLKLMPGYLWISILASLATLGGFILFFIPGIYISMATMFASNILIAENVRGLDAIKKSVSYMRGYWWAVFGRILLIGVLLQIIPIILVNYLNGREDLLLAGAVNQFFSALTMPFFVIFIYALYRELRSIKGDIPVSTRFFLS